MRFDYVKPRDIVEISKAKKAGGTLFAGGTDVFVKIRNKVMNPHLLVDTKGVETGKIDFDGKFLTIYMNTTYRDLLKSEVVKKHFPLIFKIVKTVGSPQIRNRGTPVGNVGNASPAGDFLLSLYLYEASCVIAPTMREVKISELVKGPGKLDLGEDEFIHALKVPYLQGYEGYFEKVGARNAMVISIASIGVLMKRKKNVIEDVRIAFGSVAPTILRSKEVEESVKGKMLSQDVFERIGEEYEKLSKPITDIRASADYRKKLVRNLPLKAYFNFKGEIP